VGKPGTAKSDLILKFCQAIGVPEDAYFEYMLTKFTEPSQIIGPIDIDRLKQGTYWRRTEGKLPEACVAFLDEIFKSNSAILNTLLTIINERKYYQDGKPVPVNLVMLFAATNEIPEFSELAALRDRFALKTKSDPVAEHSFDQLIDKGLRNGTYRANQQRPWANLCSLEDFCKVKRFLDLLMQESARARDEGWDDPYFPQQLYVMFKRVLKTLAAENQLEISDRKAIKLYKLIRTRAFVLRGGAVTRDDLHSCATCRTASRTSTQSAKRSTRFCVWQRTRLGASRQRCRSRQRRRPRSAVAPSCG
jgi:MoxR-like ATPase